jgi:UPF0755 protein
MASKGVKKIIAILILFISLSIFSILAFLIIERNNVQWQEGKNIVLIPSGSTYEEFIAQLEQSTIIRDMRSFKILANTMGLKDKFKCGRYRITKGLNNRQLIKMFRDGKTEKVKLILNSSYRTEEDIIKRIGEKFEMGSSAIEKIFDDEELLMQNYQLDREKARTLFLPGTYEIEWNISADALMQTFIEKRNSFWNSSKINALKKSGLSKEEAYILASIVQQESGKVSEQRKIAGVYINRLRKNMPLQADPTLIFANGDFSVRRVLYNDKQIDSPYNTYKKRGLPPGPICIPYTSALEAVIHFESHSYLYFCAKPDLSGYSNYSTTFEEHQKFAEQYRNEMDKRGINR